jgi:hypothetical protein
MFSSKWCHLLVFIRTSSLKLDDNHLEIDRLRRFLVKQLLNMKKPRDSSWQQPVWWQLEHLSALGP